MTFGNDLQDQIPAIVDYVGDGIQSLNQFRNFVRDKSHLERDYAQKLENLAKKYKAAATKKLPDNTTDDIEWDDSTSTSVTAWHSLLQQTEMLAKSRYQLVDDLNAMIIESARATLARKEDAKKKDKAKQAYDDACSEIESLRIKLNKSTGDNEKVQRQLDHAILECNNKKNSYLLALAVSNAERTKYFEVDIPALADNYYDTAMMDITKVDPEVDENLFVRDTLGSSTSAATANTEFTFLPWTASDSSEIDTDPNLVLSDSSIIFLNNKLVKDRRKLDVIGDELSKRSTELGELDSKQFMELSREMTLLATQKARVKSEIDVIIHCIGDDGLRAQMHDFRASSFTIPTTCDYCKSTIWGLSKQGMTCKACGFNCHAKCEMKVAPNCSGVRGQINQQPSSNNLSIHSSIKSPTIPRQSISSTPSFISTTIEQPQEPTDSSLPILEALYDYEARDEDELTIMEGDRLTVIDDPGDGWLKVRHGNAVGIIPANYTPEPIAAAPDYVVALYNFEAVNADELNLREGDTILVTKRDDSGWWEGVLNGTAGIFPANYVKSD
ncbi:hypothetical protein BC941DRAFT_353177 [Chlamydoabsidia padenii]|nr:hypothetical protein BC941DRAFT_353177 [Chlamydoabsidia padenii]